MLWILMMIVLLLAVGAFPSWPHSQGWGYGPVGLLAFILVALVLLRATHHL